MIWQPAALIIELVYDDTSDPVVTVTIRTPAGALRVMAEPVEHDNGRLLRLAGTHIEGPGANAVGIANIRVLAALVMERMDYDVIEIEGAVRTTGANPGRLPRRLRFARRPADPGN